MGDLISRSALLKRLNEYVFDAFDCDGIDGENVLEYQLTHNDNSTYIIQGFNDVYELLEDIPTVDAVPVVYAEWERIPYSFVGGYRCSRCGQKSLEKTFNYCGNCGAKMDGKKVQE